MLAPWSYFCLLLSPALAFHIAGKRKKVDGKRAAAGEGHAYPTCLWTPQMHLTNERKWDAGLASSCQIKCILNSEISEEGDNEVTGSTIQIPPPAKSAHVLWAGS